MYVTSTSAVNNNPWQLFTIHAIMLNPKCKMRKDKEQVLHFIFKSIKIYIPCERL